MSSNHISKNNGFSNKASKITFMILTTNNHDGFVNLFNGIDDEGWCMAGPGRFQIIKQETALVSEDGIGLLSYTKKQYNDFILNIDWKVKSKNDNSGVFVRFSDPGNDPWIIVKSGLFLWVFICSTNSRRSFEPLAEAQTGQRI